ncbi:MAG: hypothetical protein RMX59_006210 [Nostoc sp. DedSLP05]
MSPLQWTRVCLIDTGAFFSRLIACLGLTRVIKDVLVLTSPSLYLLVELILSSKFRRQPSYNL